MTMLYGRLCMMLFFYDIIFLMNIRFYLGSGDDGGIEDEVNSYHMELTSKNIDD